jgi:hypothetical protein
MKEDTTTIDPTWMERTGGFAKDMTLRDYFAAKAMQGMLANQHPYQASDEHMFARDAYTLADAMLKARADK